MDGEQGGNKRRSQSGKVEWGLALYMTQGAVNLITDSRKEAASERKEHMMIY